MSHTENNSLEKMIYDETEKRLQLMEDPGYPFPAAISKVDVALIAGGITISLILIIMCMMGVIV